MYHFLLVTVTLMFIYTMYQLSLWSLHTYWYISFLEYLIDVSRVLFFCYLVTVVIRFLYIDISAVTLKEKWVSVSFSFIYIAVWTVAFRLIYIDIWKMWTARSCMNYFKWEWWCSNFMTILIFWNIRWK